MRSAAAIALLLVPPAVAQVTMELDTAVLRIGEQAVITLRTPLDGSEVVWPQVPDSIGAHIEVLHVGGTDTLVEAGAGEAVRRIRITSFDTGFWAIPPFVFRIDGREVPTAALLLEVRATTIDEPAALRPMRGLYEPPFSLWWHVRRWGPWVLGIGAAVALLLFILKRRPRREAPSVVTVEATPDLHERVLAGLRALEEEKVWQAGRHKEYHARLTDLLRGYIEERFKVPALERTTAELMQELAVAPVEHEARLRLKHMLELADLVKFAKAMPTAPENEAMMAGAIRFVLDTTTTTPATHAS